MGHTASSTLLWLLTAVTLTTQELVKLSVTPRISAQCGQQVSLNCSVSSSRHGLSVRHMAWSLNSTSFCSVDSKGTISYHSHTPSDFHCEYEHGQLSLIFKRLKPRESGDSKHFMCKLQAQQGVSDAYTRVELQECCGTVEGVWTSEGPACTFRNVHPDGDVHWFHGSHHLSDASVRHHITKNVDEDGWLTIHSYLKRRSSHVPYNCSLKSTTSGKYLTSALVQNPEARRQELTLVGGNGAGSLRPMWIFLCISILLSVAQK